MGCRFFMDIERQQPIIMGTLLIFLISLSTSKVSMIQMVHPKELNESDVNKLARGTNTITKTPDTETGGTCKSHTMLFIQRTTSLNLSQIML